MPPRIPDETRSAILADIQAGQKSRAQIGRDHGVSPQTVKNIADEHGIERPFSREQTKNATEARQADNAHERARLARRFLDEAHRALDAMRQPYTAFNFGGKDNTYAEREMPEPPTGDKRNLMVIAATAADKHMALDHHDSDVKGTAAVDAWLDAMGVP